MERPLLDDIDRQIIALLQSNARISNAEIGRCVGLTASSVYERVRKRWKTAGHPGLHRHRRPDRPGQAHPGLRSRPERAQCSVLRAGDS
ncbi:MAG: AsnC family transcriptional regulator [Anaerolineae bacterium]|nr:AsnC family transcriptional regulator [Anaerolineae bacterium]